MRGRVVGVDVGVMRSREAGFLSRDNVYCVFLGSCKKWEYDQWCVASVQEALIEEL